MLAHWMARLGCFLAGHEWFPLRDLDGSEHGRICVDCGSIKQGEG